MQDYPENYDWLSAEKQENILHWFTKKEAIFKHCSPLTDNFVKEIAKQYKSYCETTRIEIFAAQSILDKLGIFVEYNWIGHREEYFLATRLDAEKQEEFLFCVMDG